MYKRGIALLLVALIAAVIAGCGGGGEDSSATANTSSSGTVTTSSISRPQFVRKANAICSKDAERLLTVLRKAIAQEKGLKKVEAALGPMVEDWITEIGALGAPEGEEEAVEAFLASLEADAEKAKQNPSAKIEQLAGNFADSGKAARRVGLESCALG